MQKKQHLFSYRPVCVIYVDHTLEAPKKTRGLDGGSVYERGLLASYNAFVCYCTFHFDHTIISIGTYS